MSNYHRTRLHFLIGVAGGLVFLFGVFILASAIKISNVLSDVWDLKPVSCQYWAGIPTIVTGGVLLLTAGLWKKTKLLRYISLCFVFITMVLTLGVLIEVAPRASTVHYESSSCSVGFEFAPGECKKVKEADPWYYILLFVTDIVLVLCSFVLLLLFADWILSVVAPELSHRERILSLSNSQTSQESLERLCPPQAEEQPWIQFNDVPLQTV